MKNRKAGTERPYTFREFFSIILDIAKERNVDFIDCLDYAEACNWIEKGQDEITDYSEQDIVSITRYGGSEGIYSDFISLRFGGEKDIHFATAKTLYDSKDAFLRMSAMAANICLIAREYIADHKEEFVWAGFYVYIDGSPCLWCRTIESSKEKAKELVEKHPNAKVSIRDNYTRKNVEYE